MFYNLINYNLVLFRSKSNYKN